MKPRKKGESDADYIERLEGAYIAVKKTNRHWKKSWHRMMRCLVPAASKAGQIVQYAAEITGTKDRPDVIACIDGLHSLSACAWHNDDVTIPDLPKMPKADPEKYGGDAEMILLSAIERVKQTRPPWESWRDAMPEYKGVDPQDLDWEGIANEVYDALADLEFSRGLLRLDLRSTMYDHCFERISRALREADHRVREDRIRELGQVDGEALPF